MSNHGKHGRYRVVMLVALCATVSACMFLIFQWHHLTRSAERATDEDKHVNVMEFHEPNANPAMLRRSVNDCNAFTRELNRGSPFVSTHQPNETDWPFAVVPRPNGAVFIAVPSAKGSKREAALACSSQSIFRAKKKSGGDSAAIPAILLCPRSGADSNEASQSRTASFLAEFVASGAARALSLDYEDRFGPFTVEHSNSDCTLFVDVVDAFPDMLPGTYSISMGQQRSDVTVFSDATVGADWRGLLYALHTMLHIVGTYHTSVPSDSPNVFVAPCVCISRDSPKYAFRGLHLDSARHFFEKSVVMNLLQHMSRHKLNMFHWHLSDDQGWRTESTAYPKLHTFGGSRGASLNGKKFQKYDGQAYEKPKFYSRAEIGEIVRFAAMRGITVMPEIDLPAHTGALVAASRVAGYVTNALVVAEEEAMGANSSDSFRKADDMLGGVAIAHHEDLLSGEVGFVPSPDRGNDDCRAAPFTGKAINCMGGTFGMVYPTAAVLLYLSKILGELCSYFELPKSMMPVIRERAIHIGGDEAEFLRTMAWAEGTGKKADIQASMTRAELIMDDASGRHPYAPSVRDTPEDLQARLTHWVIRHGVTRKCNRSSAVWDETLMELGIGTAKQIFSGEKYQPPRVFYWRDDRVSFDDLVKGVEKLRDNKKSARQPVHVVLTPKTRLYFDYVQYFPYNKGRFTNLQRPAPWMKYKAVTLKRAFFTHTIEEGEAFKHASGTLKPPSGVVVDGVEGCLWSELIPTAEILEYQLIPRIFALADVAWTVRSSSYQPSSPKKKGSLDGKQRWEIEYNRWRTSLQQHYVPMYYKHFLQYNSRPKTDWTIE